MTQAAAASGRSVYPDLRKGVVPLPGPDGLRHALLCHGEGLGIDVLELLPQLRQQRLVHPVVQVAQHHVVVAPPAHLHALHGEMGVPDAAAQQGHVGHHRLDEAVVGAPQHLAVRRLSHAAAGVLLGVDQRRAGEALHQQQALAHQHGGDDVIPVKADVHLHKGDESVCKLLHLRQIPHSLRRKRQPEGSHPLQNGVAAEAVDHPEAGPPSGHIQVPVHDVAAAAGPQHFVEPPDIFLIIGCDLIHAPPPSSPLVCAAERQHIRPEKYKK